MSAVNVGAVVVKDYGRLIGILTERDMLKAMAARVHTSEARVRQWMTEEPLTASAEMGVEEAAQVMLEHNFRHLPVLDGDRYVGMLCLGLEWTDGEMLTPPVRPVLTARRP